MAKVIVFGPTGSVGSYVARTAHSRGAHVVLAMRDTKKSIPGLSSKDEKNGKYERVQADLTHPDSLSAAVKTTGAKRAFIYLAHGVNDHMKASLEALKSGGIEFVVFLSSFSIGNQNPKDIESSEIIPWSHGQVEVTLDEVFGRENFVAMRPGAFATNITTFKQGINAGEFKQFGQNFQMDGVTPIDIGEVGGAILADGPKNGQHIVFVYGPQVVGQGEAIQMAGRVLGKDVKLNSMGPDEATQQMEKAFGSRAMAEYVVKMYSQGEGETTQPFVNYDEGVENVKLYTGRPATKFEDWVRDNKDLFAV